jgi:MarR family transcriptional regulator, transcriptional regulator for hemolysin
MSSHLDQSIGHQFGQTYRKLNYSLSLRFKPFDVTPEQWVVLCKLAGNDGITQKELSILVEKDQPTLTRILDCLDKKQLIRREANVHDRRSFLVTITETGRKLQQELIHIEQQVLAETMKGVSDEQLNQLRGLLAKMTVNLEQQQIKYKN